MSVILIFRWTSLKSTLDKTSTCVRRLYMLRHVRLCVCVFCGQMSIRLFACFVIVCLLFYLCFCMGVIVCVLYLLYVCVFFCVSYCDIYMCFVCVYNSLVRFFVVFYGCVMSYDVCMVLRVLRSVTLRRYVIQ